jgi:hypothetical protein
VTLVPLDATADATVHVDDIARLEVLGPQRRRAMISFQNAAFVREE